jgi:hypothetical protein
MVLLIACASLANLAGTIGRPAARELAVRMAPGSTRARLGRGPLADSVRLALPGGLAGAALAAVAVRAVKPWKPTVLDRYPAATMDARTLASAFGLTLLCGLVFGAGPAGVDIQRGAEIRGRTEPRSIQSCGRWPDGFSSSCHDGIMSPPPESGDVVGYSPPAGVMRQQHEVRVAKRGGRAPRWSAGSV